MSALLRAARSRIFPDSKLRIHDRELNSVPEVFPPKINTSFCTISTIPIPVSPKGSCTFIMAQESPLNLSIDLMRFYPSNPPATRIASSVTQLEHDDLA